MDGTFGYRTECDWPTPWSGQKLELCGCVLKVLQKSRKCTRCFLLRGIGSPKSDIFFFFFLKYKFICEILLFLLSSSLLKLKKWDAGQSVELIRFQERLRACARDRENPYRRQRSGPFILNTSFSEEPSSLVYWSRIRAFFFNLIDRK